jgi:predicted Zn-dependent protease
MQLAGSGATVPTPPTVLPAADDQLTVQLIADYQRLLQRLSSAGDLEAAAQQLSELEMPLVDEDISQARLLYIAELEAVRMLAQRDSHCLLPLVALHAETYRVHHGAGRFPLATHSRRVATAIAELAAELLSAPQERALVAVALTGLADMVETRRASIEAQRLLERALSLDKTQEAARLLLAVSYERKGRYEDAREQLEMLAAANSAHYEARVRLAILLRRLGKPEEAEVLLRAVIGERPPAWILSLAFQTLGQLLIRDARLGEAVDQLERAADRLPGDQAIQVLLAYALDRSGERRQVKRTVAALPLGEAAGSPRYRYSDEPAAGLGLLRETLRQSVTVRLPVLALALGAERRGGPTR